MTFPPQKTDISTNHKGIVKEVTNLRSNNEKLEKEKNLLRVKNELLIDTVS